MAAIRRRCAFWVTFAIVAAGLLFVATGGRSRDDLGVPEHEALSASQDELAEKARQTASNVLNRLAPAIAWKLQMLRLIGLY